MLLVTVLYRDALCLTMSGIENANLHDALLRAQYPNRKPGLDARVALASGRHEPLPLFAYKFSPVWISSRVG